MAYALTAEIEVFLSCTFLLAADVTNACCFIIENHRETSRTYSRGIKICFTCGNGYGVSTCNVRIDVL